MKLKGEHDDLQSETCIHTEMREREHSIAALHFKQHGQMKTIHESDEELVYHARCRLAEADGARAEARGPLRLPPGSGRNQPEPRHTMGMTRLICELFFSDLSRCAHTSPHKLLLCVTVRKPPGHRVGYWHPPRVVARAPARGTPRTARLVERGQAASPACSTSWSV